MGHARKLESPADDESESELNNALDLLIADFADRRGLDEQTEAVDSDTLRATSRMKAYPFNKTSWAQRVVSWFRKN